jgi:hypothetical protein
VRLQARLRTDSDSQRKRKVAALERSDNVADRGHAFAVLKRGYTRRTVIVQDCRALLFTVDGSSAGFQPASANKAGKDACATQSRGF